MLNEHYLIGVGASAGGLEAITEFLNHFANESNFTIIIAQHLSPNYKSRMVTILSKESKMDVLEITHGMPIEKGKIYITPPDSELTIKNNFFELTRPHTSHGPKPSVDNFFQSLAEVAKSRAIGVILSGTGSDGAIGIKAIKQHGGITLAQDPFTAKYDGMPLAAIETGSVDIVCPVDKMYEEIKEAIKNPNSLILVHKELSEDNKSLNRLFYLLSKRTGTDFSNYKPATILRRLVKRLEMLRLNNLKDYLDFVESNPKEIDVIFQMILIGVTEFFRDPDSFLELEKYLSKIIASKNAGDSIRIWAPGSSSGEEAYSLAILLSKILKEKILNYNIQIFATDIDEKAIAIARKGIYSPQSLEKVPPEIISEYFIRNNNDYELIKSIRSMVLFSKHDITNNPPFLKLDLICCRNLLIYFSTNLQKQIFPIFHYALNPDGYLFLGKSETIGQFSDLFSTVDNKHKIFQKRRTSSVSALRFSTFRPSRRIVLASETQTKVPTSNAEVVKNTLLTLFDYPHVLINDNMDLIEIFGDVSSYLGLSQGIMNSNIIKLANKDLQVELRSAIVKSIREKTKVKTPVRRIQENDTVNYVRIHVVPVNDSSSSKELYVIVFEPIDAEEFSFKERSSSETENLRILELEQELTATKVHLQTFIEELETSNEELQSLNEELMSTNEELQSSNEELETSNEELQSTNEELNIAYSELKAANELLEKQGEKLRISESNLKALLDSTQQIFYLIDRSYKILVFNKTASERGISFFKQVMKIGDSIIDYILSENIESFQKDFQAALGGDIIKGELSHKHPLTGEKHFYSYSLTPILDNDKIDMVAYTLVDITEIKRSQYQYKLNELFANIVLKELNYGVCILDQNRMVVKVNPSFSEIVNLEMSQLLHKPFETFFKRLNSKQSLENKNVRKVYFYENLESGTYYETTEKTFLDEEGKIFILVILKPSQGSFIEKQVYNEKARIQLLQWILESFGSNFYKITEAIHKLEKEIILENSTTTLDNLKATIQENKIELIKLQNKILETLNKELASLSKKITRISLENLIQKFRTITSQEFKADYSRIEFEIENEDTHIQTNPIILLLVLRLIIQNSINYSFPDKSIYVRINCNNNKLQLSVKDEGIGILETDLSKIPTPFYRGKNTVSIKGAGLGLTIAQNAIKFLNGEMKIESKASQFTKVTVLIPV